MNKAQMLYFTWAESKACLGLLNSKIQVWCGVLVQLYVLRHSQYTNNFPEQHGTTCILNLESAMKSLQ